MPHVSEKYFHLLLPLLLLPLLQTSSEHKSKHHDKDVRGEAYVTYALGFFSIAYTNTFRDERSIARRDRATSGPRPAPATVRTLKHFLSMTINTNQKLYSHPFVFWSIREGSKHSLMELRLTARYGTRTLFVPLRIFDTSQDHARSFHTPCSPGGLAKAIPLSN